MRSHVGIATVFLVNTKNTSDELSIPEKGRKGGLRKVRSKERLSLLLLLLLTTELASVLRSLKALELLATHLSSLQGLQLAQLDRVELLPVHLGNHHLAGQLHKLGLVGVVLEGPN